MRFLERKSCDAQRSGSETDVEGHICPMIVALECCTSRGPTKYRRLPQKYTERIAAIFGTAEQFAAAFSEAIVITSSRLHT